MLIRSATAVDKINKKVPARHGVCSADGERYRGLCKAGGTGRLAAAAVVDVLGAGFKIAKEWNEAGRDMRPINFGKAADDFAPTMIG